MILSWLSDLLGTVPEDYAVLLYIFGGIVLFFLLCEAFRFLHAVFKGVSQL